MAELEASKNEEEADRILEKMLKAPSFIGLDKVKKMLVESPKIWVRKALMSYLEESELLKGINTANGKKPKDVSRENLSPDNPINDQH